MIIHWAIAIASIVVAINRGVFDESEIAFHFHRLYEVPTFILLIVLDMPAILAVGVGIPVVKALFGMPTDTLQFIMVGAGATIQWLVLGYFF